MTDHPVLVAVRRIAEHREHGDEAERLTAANLLAAICATHGLAWLEALAGWEHWSQLGDAADGSVEDFDEQYKILRNRTRDTLAALAEDPLVKAEIEKGAS